MAIIGITGGIGAGKSMVLKNFAALGARVAEADQLAHQVYQKNSEPYRQMVTRWGKAITDENEDINRRALAGIVFNHPEELDWLNGIVHPEVKKIIHSLDNEYPQQFLWCAIPLLFEAGWEDRIYRVISVWCKPEIQRERLLARRWTEQEIEQRTGLQWSPEAKAEKADFVIVNCGSQVSLREQCRILYKIIENKQDLQ